MRNTIIQYFNIVILLFIAIVVMVVVCALFVYVQFPYTYLVVCYDLFSSHSCFLSLSKTRAFAVVFYC